MVQKLDGTEACGTKKKNDEAVTNSFGPGCVQLGCPHYLNVAMFSRCKQIYLSVQAVRNVRKCCQKSPQKHPHPLLSPPAFKARGGSTPPRSAPVTSGSACPSHAARGAMQISFLAQARGVGTAHAMACFALPAIRACALAQFVGCPTSTIMSSQVNHREPLSHHHRAVAAAIIWG